MSLMLNIKIILCGGVNLIINTKYEKTRLIEHLQQSRFELQ